MPAARQPPFADYDDEETDSDEDIRETYGYDMKVWRADPRSPRPGAQTERQTDGRRDRLRHRQTERQTERQTDGQTDRLRHRQTERQTERQRDRLRDRQTDRRTD